MDWIGWFREDTIIVTINIPNTVAWMKDSQGELRHIQFYFKYSTYTKHLNDTAINVKMKETLWVLNAQRIHACILF